MCSTEEVIGEVVGSVLNEVMVGFDNAIAPPVIDAANASSAAGSSGGSKAAGSSPFGALAGLLQGGGLTSLLPGGLGGLLPGGLGALKGMKFDINTAMGFIDNIPKQFPTDFLPISSPNLVHTMASGGLDAEKLSMESIVKSAVNQKLNLDSVAGQLGNLEGLAGQLGNLEGLTGQLGNLEGLTGQLGNLEGLTGQLTGGLASKLTNFELPNASELSELSEGATQGLSQASSQFSSGFSQLQEGLPDALDEMNKDLEDLT